MVKALEVWLTSTKLAWFVIHYSWVWSVCETIHFIGLTLLLGVVLLIDLRMLGMGKHIPFAGLHQLLPWAIFGFGLNTVTGIMFLTAAPDQYLSNPAFYFKMLFILLAGVNVLVFYLSGIFRKAEALGPGDDAQPSAKLVAAISIFLWFGVIFWGRLMPFLGLRF